VRGFVLAAGFGTRLKPITDHIPKALVKVGGKPLLERSLAFLRKSGIETIGVNTHYLAEQLFEYQRSSAIPFELFHEKDTIRGTGGAFNFARDFLGGDDTFFVCNVDIVYSFDLPLLIERFLKSDLTCGLLAVKAKERGSIYYQPENGLYSGVPADGPTLPGSVRADFIGAAFYRKEFLEVVTPEDFSVVPVWARALQQGLKTGVLIVDGCYWRDIGTPASLAQAHFDALDGALSLEVPERLVIDRNGLRCMPAGLAGSLRRNIGSYAWVETEKVPDGCRIASSIVYSDAILPSSATVDHKIVTSFGEVAFG
jgi:NDP-sugar pyrophosphorylase family protein